MDTESPIRVALDDARHHIITARAAAARHDIPQQTRSAQSAIGCTADALLTPRTPRRYIAAAHYLLAVALILDGRGGQCGADPTTELAALSTDDRHWLISYLGPAAAGRTLRRAV